MIAKTNDTRNIHRYRILHVFRAPVGGLFRHVMDLARLQAAAGHAVGIVCDSTTGGERGERALADLMPYLELGLIRIPMRRNPHASDWSCLRAVSKRAATVGAEVIHGHGAKGGAYARLAVGGLRDPRLYPARWQLQLSPRQSDPPPLHGRGGRARPPHRRLPVRERVRRRTPPNRSWVDPERVTRIVHNGIAEAEFAPVERVEDPVRPPVCRRTARSEGPPLPARSPGPPARRRPDAAPADGGFGPGRGDPAAAPSSGWDWRTRSPSSLHRRSGRCLPAGGSWWSPRWRSRCPTWCWKPRPRRSPSWRRGLAAYQRSSVRPPAISYPPGSRKRLAEGIRRVLDDAPDVLSARVHALSASIRQRFSLERMGSEVIAGYASAFQARARPPRRSARVAGPRTA